MTDNCKLRCAVYSDLSYVLPSAAKQTDSHSTRSVSDSEAESCRRPAAQKATGQMHCPHGSSSSGLAVLMAKQQRPAAHGQRKPPAVHRTRQWGTGTPARRHELSPTRWLTKTRDQPCSAIAQPARREVPGTENPTWHHHASCDCRAWHGNDRSAASTALMCV